MRAPLAFLVALLSIGPIPFGPTAALAQRQPASITTIPSATPQEFDILGKTGSWLPLGRTAGIGWQGAGAAIEVDQFGAKGDFINDDGLAIVAAINAAAANGGTVVLAGHPYWNKAQAIVVPNTVHLTCAVGLVKRRTNAVGYQNMPCAIYENAGTSVSPGPASFTNYGVVTDIGVLHDAVHSYPSTTTRAQIEALISAFYGTGIKAGDNDAGFTGTASIIQNVLIGGFGTCIAQNGAAQVQIRQTLGDCTNGYDLAGSFDNNFLQDMEFWEFLTASLPTGTTSWNITGMADNGSGQWRLTIASSADPPVTGEKLWVFPGSGTLTAAPGGSGAQGLWTVTAIDSTHVDLQGSVVAPSTTGNTSNGRTYIAVTSTADLAPGMNVTGAGIPAGAKIGAVWRSRAAISLDQAHPATATASGVALSFTNDAYSGSGGVLHFEKNVRSGTGFAIGYADGTTCAGCFEYGFLNGFSFRGGSFASFTNSNIDGPGTMPANKNVTPIGLQFTGNTNAAFFQTNGMTTTALHILNNGGTTGVGGRNVVVWGYAGGASQYNGTFLENVSGGFSLSGPAVTYSGSWLLDDAAPIPTLSNVNTPNALIYGTTSQPRFYGGGNVFGGSLDQQTPISHKAQTFFAASAAGGTNYNFYDASRPIDEKYWRLQAGNSSLCAQTLDDAYTTAGGSGFCIHRSGNTVTDTTMNAPMIVPSFGVAGLPACNAGLKGANAYVINGQASPPYLGAVSTTGTTVAPVFCNGAGWVYH